MRYVISRNSILLMMIIHYHYYRHYRLHHVSLNFNIHVLLFVALALFIIHCVVQIKCPTLVQHVHLCHLQSLFLALESKRDATKEGGGDPLHQVALKYREPLPESVRITVCSALAMGDIDCGVFIPLLREFASEQLCTGEYSEQSRAAL